MVTLHEVITFLVSMQISISSLQTHNVNRCGRSRHLARKDRKSGSAGMPRPISYAVFCLKKKITAKQILSEEGAPVIVFNQLQLALDEQLDMKNNRFRRLSGDI